MKVDGNEIKIPIYDLLHNEDVLRAITKSAIFDTYLIEGLIKWLMDDKIDWDHNPDGDMPWYIYTTANGSVLEKARAALLPLVDEIVRNENERLRAERDEKANQRDEKQNRIFVLERLVMDAYQLGWKHASDGNAEMMHPRGHASIEKAVQQGEHLFKVTP